MKKNFILIIATLLVIAGCSTEYEILKSQEAIILTADSSVKVIDETVTFTVKDKEGVDLTLEVEFFVNGEAIEGNTFTSHTVGNFNVTAKYFSVESDPLMVNFHDGTGINFRKRMLIEDYTGTWCGYCPRVAWAIELVHQQTEDAVAVAIHRPSSNESSPVYDPYNFPAAAELESSLGGAGGYPKGFLNRTMQWSSLEPDHINEAIGLTQGENPKLGLAMTSAVSNGNITLDVNVMFGKDFTNNLRLVVYVLENGLVYEQHNYTSYYDGVDVLEDFDHNHVLRATLTNIMGDDINGAEATTGNVFTRSFTATVPANVANADNLEFVAFVIDETGKVVNVRKVGKAETQTIELL